MVCSILGCALFIPGGALFIPRGCLIHPQPALIIPRVGLNWSPGMNWSLYLMSVPYAVHFCTIHNGTTTRLVLPMWRNVVRPCLQNCGHGASNSPTSTRRMRLVTYSAPCPPVRRHVQRSPSPKVCVLRCATGYGHSCVVQNGRSIQLCDGPRVQLVWLRQKETQRTCSPKREPEVP